LDGLAGAGASSAPRFACVLNLPLLTFSRSRFWLPTNARKIPTEARISTKTTIAAVPPGPTLSASTAEALMAT
jgi:hypothetical protein